MEFSEIETTVKTNIPMKTQELLVHTPSASNGTLKTSIDKATVLKDICVYVEVQAMNLDHSVVVDRSDVVVKEVLTLEAKVSKSLGKQCTHMVFFDGNLATYNKAKSLGVFIVSVNWIQACKEQQKLVDEKLYPPRSKQEYENGWTPLHWAANSGQLKVFKSHSREG